MLTVEERAFLEEMRVKHLPGRHDQDSHGNDHGIDVGDKLKLAGKIPLDEGESLVGSGTIAPGFPFALTEVAGQRSMRLGVVDPGDDRNWRGRFLGSTVQLEPGEMAALRTKAPEVAQSAQDYREDMRIAADEVDGFDGIEADRSTLTDEQQKKVDEYFDLRNGHVFERGVLATGTGDDLVYEIRGDDVGEDDENVVVEIGVKPWDAGDDWELGDGHTTRFDQDEFEDWAVKIAKALAELSGDQPKAFLEQMAAKHLPGRHDQRTHGRHSVANRAAQAAQELGELRESIARAQSRQPRDDSDDSDDSGSGFRWMSPDDAMAMRKQMLEGDPWTFEQQDALNRYTGSAYGEMNGLLRGDPFTVDALSDGEKTEFTALIRDANAGMRPTTEPVKVKRFVGGFQAFGLDMSKLTREEAAEALGAMKGTTFQDAGFMSTSLGENYGAETWTGRIKLELDVPAGAKGAYLDGDVGFDREQELLLAPGTAFEITDVVIDPPRNTVRGRVIVS